MTEEAKTEKLSIFNANELQKEEIPELIEIVNNFLYEGLAILAAPPKSGKSWFSLQLGLAVSEGNDFLGNKTLKGDVLYLALEDSKRRLQNRLNIMLGNNEAPKGFNLCIECKQIDTGLITQLKEILVENPNIKLIIIDTLQLVRGQVNKSDTLYGNDYKEIGKIKKIADANHICILLIHHFRKMTDISDTFNQISGSTGITGAADTMMTLSKEERFDNKTILSITGRDIEAKELLLTSDKKTNIWQVINSQDDLRKINQEESYNLNPVIITIKKLLEKNPEGFEITSRELYEQIFFCTGNKPRVKSPSALTKQINNMSAEMLQYDNIFYEPPNANGGGSGRKLYFCKYQKD